MRQLMLAGLIAMVSGFAQPPQSPQQRPWSEQPPLPQAQGPQQGDSGQDDEGSAPDHGVARISTMNGNVSVRRGDSGDMVAAIMNAPLAVNDRVVTAEGSRAEVQFDSANLVRLGPATEIRLSDLQYGRYQIQVATGTTVFRVLRDSSAQVEISTPSIAVRPLKRGVYRVTVRPDGTSEITVRGGDAEVFGPRGSEQIHSGSTMLVRGSSNDPEFQMTGALPEDELDRWAVSRDQQLERAQSPRYVDRDVYGAEDLDGNGRWVNDPQYGQVWAPTVDPGWAPYRCGRWVWVDYYGWTWVGCESWGWAPYHYGRWYQASFGWAWWPGLGYGHHYWRPALVGFFGWGGGVGVGFGFGHVGWCPLAPYERFHAWYGSGYRGTTIVNNVNVTNVYRNARFGGVTGMDARQFGRANVSNANFVRPSSGDLTRAGAMRGGVPVSPSNESRHFSDRVATTHGLPQTSSNTRFFSHGQSGSTPQSQAQPFNRGTNAPASNGTTNGGGWRRAESPASTPSNNSGGWRPFNPSANSPGGGQGNRPSVAQPSTNNGGGWQRQAPSASTPQGNRPSMSQPSTSTPQQSPSVNRGGWQRYDGASRGGYQTPSSAPAARAQQQNYNPPPRAQQPQVRVSPPIVQNRGNNGGGFHGNSAPAPSHPSGGGSRGSSGGGGGNHGGSGGHGGHR